MGQSITHIRKREKEKKVLAKEKTEKKRTKIMKKERKVTGLGRMWIGSEVLELT